MADTLAVLAGKIDTLERLVRDLSRTSRLANSSIENGSIAVYDDGGTLRGSIGMQDDGTVALAAVNGPTPPVPSVPAITSVLGGVAVSWDGTFSDGSPAPADFGHVEVHFSTGPDFTDDDSMFSAFYSTSGGTMIVPAQDPVWVRLVCLSTSDAVSAPSAVAGPAGPAPVVAQAVLDGIITELALADGAVSTAKLAAAAVDAEALAAGAVTAQAIGLAAVTATALAAGSVATGALQAGAVTAGAIAAGSVTTAALDAAAVTAGKIAAGSVTTVAMTAGSINGDRLAVGTIAADRIAAASITAAQIHALGITGDRLAVNTVTADRLAAGTITAASGVISSIDASKITVGKISASQIDATSLVVFGGNVTGQVASAASAGTAAAATTVTGSIGAAVSVPAGQISTGQIPAATTINGASITTGTIDASKVAVANLDASAIKAGTISVDRLSVGLQGSTGQKFYDFGDSASKWLGSGPGTMTTVAVADAQSGGSVMRCVGYVQGAYRPDIKIPFDPNVTYRVSARVRQTVANGTPGTNQKLYAGVAGLAADGVTFVNTAGANSTSSQFYAAVNSQDLTAGAGWVTYTGYIKGTSASPTGSAKPSANAPGQLHTGVRYITPILYLNYTGGTGTAEVDMFAIEVVESGSVQASNIIAGAVDGQTITGAVLRTRDSGQRVEMVPHTPIGLLDGAGQLHYYPGLVWYTGDPAEVTPGLMTQYVRPGEFANLPTVLIQTPDVGNGVCSFYASGGVPGGDVAQAHLVTGAMSMNQSVDTWYVSNGADVSMAVNSAGLTVNGALVALVQDWTTPALASGYSGNGNSNGTVQYRVLNLLGTRVVQWRGGLGLTYSGGVLANAGSPFASALPTIARPASRRTVTAAASLATSTKPSMRIDFETDGAVNLGSTTDTPPWISLNGVTYSL